MGVIYVPDTYIKKELNEKKLKHILSKFESNPIEVYISYPTHKYIPMKTQLFINYLKEQWKILHQDNLKLE